MSISSRETGLPAVDQSGCTPLHYAASAGNHEEVARLLDAGLDVNARDEDGWTPLHFAAQSKSAKVVELLIAAGAAVDAVDQHGNTPLWTAVFTSKGNGVLIALLRSAGADPHKANLHGVSALTLARNIASHDVARFFSDLP
ncbi:MAG TPA: ankyrin repeat domain-containing protein [Gallionellaceae bacterium]|nr:ankyrin repeat domain-containing protein [Gallionellaceae bacterium]